MNKAVLEGLLFVVGEEGLTLIDLCSIIGVDDDVILNSLNDDVYFFITNLGTGN